MALLWMLCVMLTSSTISKHVEGKTSFDYKFVISQNRSIVGNNFKSGNAQVKNDSCPLCACATLCGRDESCGAVSLSKSDEAENHPNVCQMYNDTIRNSDLTDGNDTLLNKYGVIGDCYSFMIAGQLTSGVSTIHPYPGDDSRSYEVFCDMTTEGGGWTVLLRRQDGSVNFTRDWEDYKSGFGNVSGEFWAGNELMYKLTSAPWASYRVRVDLISFQDEYRYAEYDMFVVDAETDNYRLHIRGYSGNATDSFATHDNMMFSTIDRDHDTAPYSCAVLYGGGFWYTGCSDARLTGVYGETTSDTKIGRYRYPQGILWYFWLGTQAHPRFVEMKIKPNV